jgi:hypothetical protein
MRNAIAEAAEDERAVRVRHTGRPIQRRRGSEATTFAQAALPLLGLARIG